MEKIFFGSGSVNTFPAEQTSENHQFSLKIFKTLEGHNSLNFGRRRKFQTFLESSDNYLSKKWRFVFGYLNQKNVQSWKRKKVRKSRFMTYIYVMAGNVLTGSGEKIFLCSNVFFSIKQQVKIIFGKIFFRFGVG